MFCLLYTTFERTKYTTFLPVQTVATFFVVIYHGDDTKDDHSLDTKVVPSFDTKVNSSLATYKGPSLHPHTTALSHDNTLTQACSNVFCPL
ncbi:hypothetical protein EV715DRAFT_209357 [Schizophyllum commune]